MAEPLIKNIEHSTTHVLKDLIGYETNQIASLTLAQSPALSVTLLALDEGEGLSTHAAPGDAMATILEGEAEITIDETRHAVKAGECIVMPRDIPHAVHAATRFKFLLTVVKSA